jgi:hypothetical protein
MQGSGWPSGHVAIDHYFNWDRPGGQEKCLNHDTESPAELIAEIDSLIEELQSLKREVPERFKQWKLLTKPRG